MKLLIISDLHLDEQNDWDFIDMVTQDMVHRVSNKMVKNEELIVVVLGDIINRGGDGNIEKKFSEADKFFGNLKYQIGYTKCLFIPGNHEIVDFGIDAFNEFCKHHSYKEFMFTMKNSVFSIEEAGINLILVDTNLTRNYDLQGKIDVNTLRDCMRSDSKNIIFMHHPPVPLEGADRSIVNSKELVATCSNFIFYGHQHGGVKIPDFLEHDTDIHSVGTLFSHGKCVSNEFLLIDVLAGKIDFAYRYVHNGKFFVANLLFPPKAELKSERLHIGEPDEVETSILRKLKRMSYSDDEIDNDSSVLQSLIGENIDAVVKEHSRLLLVGDAGIGKSFELANIYWHYKENEEYFPIWINLRNTNYAKIKEIISYGQLNTIDRKLPLLIIDGLDEISGDNIGSFCGDIGAAVYGNPELRIILSSRTNFRIAIDGFTKYMILPLERNEILTIASQNNIDKVDAFWECLDNSGCSPLAKIPFYLFGIIHIYSETGSLPECNQLLDQMISFRFIKADERYPSLYEDSIIGNEYQVRLLLKKLGFFIQSLHEYSLGNNNYTRFFTTLERTFINKTGLISLKENELGIFCEFEHNIFREYLVADFLRTTKFEYLIKIITYDEESKKLRPSWKNVVAFLLTLREGDDLKQWLVNNATDTIYEFESDRFGTSEKNEIFKAMMEDCFHKDCLIYSLYNEQKVAKYFQSEASISFLISILQRSVTVRATLGVLHILCYYTSFYGKEDELKDNILRIITPDQPEYTVTYSIKALANIYSSNLQIITTEIYDVVKNDYRSGVVAAFCNLLVRALVADEYADFILDKLERFEKSPNSFGNLSDLSNAIRALKNPENIMKAVRWFCVSQNSWQYYEGNQLFAALISKLLPLFQNGNSTLLDDIVLDFAYVAGKCDKQKSGVLKRFLADAGKLVDAFRLLLKFTLPQLDIMFAIEDMMEESLTEVLIESFFEDEVDAEIYKWYARRLPEDSAIFIKLNDAAIKKEGQIIQREQITDWDKNNKEGSQIYFDSLFSSERFNVLIKELLGFYSEHIMCGELLGGAFSKVIYRQDMQHIITACYHWGRADCPVSQFVDSIDWSAFSISEICRILQNQPSVEVTDEEEQAINAYYKKTISEANFGLFDENNPECNYLLRQASHVIYLMERFDFACSDEKLMEFLVLPWQVFAAGSSSNESLPLQFVTERISNAHTLRKKILENIAQKSIPLSAFHTHIVYCLENKLPDAIDLAIELFCAVDANLKWRRFTAVDYLIIEKGNKYVDGLIDDTTDNELLTYLASKLRTENENLISKLIERNKSSANHMAFLAELIKLFNSYGLEIYIKLAVEANSIPDFHTDSSRIPEITEAIGEVNDISLIHYISILLEICYSEGFKDQQDIGLRRSLQKAVYNLIQIDILSVKEMLLGLIDLHSGNNELTAICYWYVNDIEKILHAKSDLALSVTDTLAFYECIKRDIEKTT